MTTTATKKKTMKKKTKKQYEEELNDLGKEDGDNFFWMQQRKKVKNFGSWIRRTDPIQFEVGFNEWKLKER